MMNMNDKTESNSWIYCTVLFVVMNICILVISMWKPIWGFVIVLILLLSVFVGSILKAFCQKKDTNNTLNNIKLLDQKTIDNSQKLLRYATSVLAFLSLVTTASGMQSFVFDKKWMAYLGSFAIQSILIVFSLLLCRFFVQVTTLDWKDYIKKLVNQAMIVFFCMVLVVSSIFSFSFIANNAYRSSWLGDSEIIIQNYLMGATYRLQEENDRRGKKILEDINFNAKEKLLGAMYEAENVKRSDGNRELDELINLFPFEKLEIEKCKINENEFKNIFSQYPEQASTFLNTYNNTYSERYDEEVRKTNKIINTIEGWKNTTIKLETAINEMEEMKNTLERSIENLTNLKSNIDGLRTSRLVNDVSAYKNSFVTNVDLLIGNLEDLNEYIQKMYEQCEIVNDSTGNGVDEKVEQLLSGIYLLGLNDLENEYSSIENLIKEVNALALEASHSDTFNSEQMQNIVFLKEDLILYSEYLALKDMISYYIRNRLKKTYNVEGKLVVREQRESNFSNEEQVQTDIVIVDMDKWKESRIEDFYMFYTFVKALPDISEDLQEDILRYIF